MPTIRFEFETQHGKYADAISYDEIENPMTPEEIEAEKQRRLDNWLALVAAAGA